MIHTVRTLGTKALGNGALSISETRNLLLALLHDDAVQSLDIRADNATTDGLPAALTSAAHTVARVALTEEQTDTLG